MSFEISNGDNIVSINFQKYLLPQVVGNHQIVTKRDLKQLISQTLLGHIFKFLIIYCGEKTAPNLIDASKFPVVEFNSPEVAWIST